MMFADFNFISQTSVGICMLSLCVLLWLLRQDGPSLGLPFAYLALLLVNHVPGAIVPLLDTEFSAHLLEVATGIKLTAIGVVCFVIGVWYARRGTLEQSLHPQKSSHLALLREDHVFWFFCLLGGWIFTFGLTPLRNLPSIGAVVYGGGAIWMLGVMLGLRWSIREKRKVWTAIWFGCLAVYPVMILFTAGFLGYGAAAALIVVSALAVSGRGYVKVFVVIAVVIYFGLSLFSNYFQARDRIRAAVWWENSIERRIDAISEIITDWKFFDTSDQLVLAGLDVRLNQNYFVGLAAQNLESGAVDYLYGRSVSDAVLSLVPRAFWPGKTVAAGSSTLVADMTGLDLASNTSWGVGNVMEFYINFGLYGLVVGFLILGWAMGRLDHRAGIAEARGDYSIAIRFFLPGVALIQPIGSMVELVGGASSAWLAAYFWKWVWAHWQDRKQMSAPAPQQAIVP